MAGFVLLVYFLSEKISSKEMPTHTTLIAPMIMIGIRPTKWLIKAVATSSRLSSTPSAKKIVNQAASKVPTLPGGAGRMCDSAMSVPPRIAATNGMG